MPELSYLLERLIEEKNTNAFQISKQAKLDRTTLQRTLKGERLPSLSFIEKLCDHLNVFPSEREEVLKLYKIKKIGRNVYNNRLFIKDMLEQISFISTSVKNIPVNNHDININYIEENNIKIVVGKTKVNSIVADIIQDEFYNQPHPALKLYIPFNFTFFFDYLKSICSEFSDYSIQHILKLGKNTASLSDSNYNLKVLTNVLPFAFMKHGNYEPYYYYGSTNQSVDKADPFPFYIITKNYLILLSSDFDKVIIESITEIVDVYLSSFDDTLKYSKKFITSLNDPVKLATSYTNYISKSKDSFISIAAQPVFGHFFDKHLIDAKIINDILQRKEIFVSANALYDTLRKVKSIHNSYFSIEGLEYFIEYGQIPDVPDGCVTPFTKIEITSLLKQLVDNIISDEFNTRLIDSSKFTTPTNSVFLLFDQETFMLTARREDGSIVACIINESSITDSILDFSLSFEDEGYLYSKEETVMVLNKTIDRLSKRSM